MSATLMELSHLGLRSALEFFSAVAEALQWILAKKASKICSTTSMTLYLFPSQGKSLLLINTFCSLRSSPRTLKLEGPATCLTFLGI